MTGSTIRVRTSVVEDGLEVKLLVRHPMQVQVVDEAGAVVSQAHHITHLSCRLDGMPVFEATLGTGISKNPFFSFVVPGAAAGALEVEWRDNRGAGDRLVASL